MKTEAQKKSQRDWKSRNKASLSAYSREYRLKNGDKVRAAERRKYHRNKPAAQARARRCSLKRRYGLTLEQYDAMVAAQDGKCGICLQSKTLVVDHCHTTGQVRMLLCRQCNAALGMFMEDEGNLNRALSYVTRFKSL